MKKLLSKWHIIYFVVLILFTAYVILDTFVIPHTYSVIDESTSTDSSTIENISTTSNFNATSSTSSSVTRTSNSYDNGNIKINIKEYREYDTTIHVADVTVADAAYLKTAFANKTYGKNITETTSDIADSVNAILSINGDYYSARSGYVIKNGIVYRSTSAGSDQEDLAIYKDGSFKIINEGEISANELVNDGATELLSFGPSLINNSTTTVSQNDEVAKAMSSNPRTAIGIISPLHYIFVVADGRTNESEGLSLYQLANFMKTLNVTCAYNLDGGGSSTMVFDGTVINSPTTNGNRISERKVSDIVYIG